MFSNIIEFFKKNLRFSKKLHVGRTFSKLDAVYDPREFTGSRFGEGWRRRRPVNKK